MIQRDIRFLGMNDWGCTVVLGNVTWILLAPLGGQSMARVTPEFP